MKKTGILIVSFGTTYEETRKKNIEALEQEVQRMYPEIPCYRAFSSGMVRKILRERDGIHVMEVKEALLQMKEDGISHVKILPTHIIDGLENNKVRQRAEECRPLFEEVTMARALLETETDYEKAAGTLWQELSQMAAGKILLFMGHGSSHEANAAYEKLEGVFCRLTGEDVFVATVEGTPELSDARQQMARLQKKQVILTPFMLVAGDHAVNDMAGEEDSWRTELEADGYAVTAVVKGLGEYAGIRSLYLEHLQEIMEPGRKA